MVPISLSNGSPGLQFHSALMCEPYFFLFVWFNSPLAALLGRFPTTLASLISWVITKFHCPISKIYSESSELLHKPCFNPLTLPSTVLTAGLLDWLAQFYCHLCSRGSSHGSVISRDWTETGSFCCNRAALSPIVAYRLTSGSQASIFCHDP